MSKKNEKEYKKVTEQIRMHKKKFAIYIILRVLVIMTLILQMLNKNYENVFLCILTLMLFLIPSQSKSFVEGFIVEFNRQ